MENGIASIKVTAPHLRKNFHFFSVLKSFEHNVFGFSNQLYGNFQKTISVFGWFKNSIGYYVGKVRSRSNGMAFLGFFLVGPITILWVWAAEKWKPPPNNCVYDMKYPHSQRWIGNPEHIRMEALNCLSLHFICSRFWLHTFLCVFLGHLYFEWHYVSAEHTQPQKKMNRPE